MIDRVCVKKGWIAALALLLGAATGLAQENDEVDVIGKTWEKALEDYGPKSKYGLTIVPVDGKFQKIPKPEDLFGTEIITYQHPAKDVVLEKGKFLWVMLGKGDGLQKVTIPDLSGKTSSTEILQALHAKSWGGELKIWFPGKYSAVGPRKPGGAPHEGFNVTGQFPSAAAMVSPSATVGVFVEYVSASPSPGTGLLGNPFFQVAAAFILVGALMALARFTTPERRRRGPA